MKTTIRSLSLLLAALFCLSVAVACKKEEPDIKENNNTNATEPQEKVHLNLPELKYDGEPLDILVRTSSLDYHQASDTASDTLGVAVFKRNSAVSELLDVTFEFSHMNGFSSGSAAFQDAIRTSVMGGGTFDIVSPGQSYGNALIVENMYSELGQYDYLDLDESYWWKGYIDQATVNGKLFSLAGDFSVDAMQTWIGVFFNKKELTSYQGMEGFENPYTMVENGNWTLDKMFALSKEATVDTLGDGVFDETDKYGVVSGSQGTQYLLNACDIQYITKNGDAYEVTLGSQKSFDLFDKLESKIALNHYKYYGNADDMRGMFINSQALFMFDTFENISGLKGSDVDYGVLICPKYDDAQQSFITPTVGGTVFVIPALLGEARSTRAAAVLQAFGYYSYIHIRPAHYENVIKGQSMKDPESYAMMDQLRDTVYYDIGAIYNSSLKVANDYHKCLRDGKSFRTFWNENEGAYKQRLADWYADFPK